MIYDKQIATKLYEEYKKRKTLAIKQYDYYRGKTDIFKDYKTTDRSNRKIVDNFIRTFIEEEVSFMVGQPITYIADEEIVNAINDSINNISTTLDMELCTNLLIYGEAYELYYMNNGEFKIKELNPLNSIAYCNTEGNAELFMYFYKKELDDTLYIDVFDDNYIYHFKDGFIENEPPTQHFFNCVPVGVAILNSGVDDTLYNNLKSLQDAYEACMSDYSNEISDTRLAYMVLTGCSLDEETAKQMKQMGILQLPDSNSKADWLIKNVSSDFIRNYRDIIKEDIYRVANHIDNQEGVQSNTSGTMLITRMNCLRLKIINQNNCLKNCLKERVKNLFTYLNLVENKQYDYKGVKIQLQINLPQNNVEMAQIMTQLSGKMSIRTGLSQLSFVTNADEEFNKMLEEQKMLLEQNNVDLDNLEGVTDETI